ncbi:phage antirepressor N-terminal domain-containing protein [Pseudomonas lini]
MTMLMEQLSLGQFNIIKGVIRDKAKAVPTENRQSFQLVMHNRLHTRFNVARTELIPASEFESACSFVAAYAIEGEFLGREGKGVELPTELSPTQRFIVFTDGAGNRQIQPVPIDAYVMSPMQFLGAIAGENGIHVPPAALFRLCFGGDGQAEVEGGGMSALMTIPFHGVNLMLVDLNGQPYVPMRPVVEGIGLDWGGQHKKLTANPARWGVSVTEIPSAGGSSRSLACHCVSSQDGFRPFKPVE